MKNRAFCNIGMNELVAPLYDLDIVQLAELRSAKGKDSFAWPEYLSRSILLVGTDYFLLYDQTGTNWRAGARFSWFVQKEDEFPQIVFFGKKHARIIGPKEKPIIPKVSTGMRTVRC